MNTQLNDQAKKQAAIAKVLSTMTRQEGCAYQACSLICS
jgi:hypothetical protein